MKVSFATPADFPAILALQAENHLNYLPASARGDGFLTTWLETPKLEFLCAGNGIFVAKNGFEITGYACADPWDLRGNRGFHNDVVAQMPLQLGNSLITAQNSLLYGPVCVAAAFRGQMVLAALVEAIKIEFQARFDFALTFIDYRNLRSLAAHERKLGFQIVGELPYDDTTYHMLACPL